MLSRVDVVSGKRSPLREIGIADPIGFVAPLYLRVTGDGRCYVYGFRRKLSELFLVDGLR